MKNIRNIVLILIVMMTFIRCENSTGTKDINKSSVTGVEITDLQLIDDKVYKYGDEKPYTGKVITRYEDAKINMIQTYNNGKAEGEVTSYYENGSLKEKYSLKADKIEGQYEWYGQNEEIKTTATYKNNEKIDETTISLKDKKPFTGTYSENFENGNINQVVKFKDGKRDGETIFYYDNGKIRERISYVNGNKEG